MEIVKPSGKKRIVVALDVTRLDQAGDLIKLLAPHVGMFKVGLQLLTAEGAPRVVKYVQERGGKVFFDGKFADIPNTTGEASFAVSSMGVKMFNLHSSSGSASMKRAVDNKGKSLVLAVTVLTSIPPEECFKMNRRGTSKQVLHLAHKAQKAGVDGIICSPLELKLLAKADELSHLLRVIPGIRPTGTSADDQKRISTPYNAVLDGADYLVIGRAIRTPPEEIGGPVEAVQAIIAEILAAEKKLAV